MTATATLAELQAAQRAASHAWMRLQQTTGRDDRDAAWRARFDALRAADDAADAAVHTHPDYAALVAGQNAAHNLTDLPVAFCPVPESTLLTTVPSLDSLDEG